MGLTGAIGRRVDEAISIDFFCFHILPVLDTPSQFLSLPLHSDTLHLGRGSALRVRTV